MLPGPARTRSKLVSSYWFPGNLGSMWYIPFLLQMPSPVNIPITQPLNHRLRFSYPQLVEKVKDFTITHRLEVLAKHMLLASSLNPKDVETSIIWYLASSMLLAQYYP